MGKAERAQDQPVVDAWLAPTEGPPTPPEPADLWERGKRRLAREIRNKGKTDK